MKRFAFLVLAAIMIVSMSFVVPAAGAYAADGEEVETMSFYAYPRMNSIRIEWKQKSGVDFYRVYRVDLKNRRDRTPAMSEYAKVGTVSGGKSSWTDTEVEKNHCYGYVVRGYKAAEGKKAVLAYDSYMEDDCDYACANLDRPEVLNGGNGEFEANSKDQIFVFVQRDSGVRPDGVEIYRKAEGESEYEKIKARKAEKGRFDQGKYYEDATVKPGETYSYRARTFKRFLWIKTYSSYSKAIVIPAVNFKGTFDTEAVTKPGTVKAFVIKVTGDKYNGVLTVNGDAPAVYSADSGNGESVDQAVTLTAYSQDNRNWSAIPSSGIAVKGDQTCYLKYAFDEGEGFFGGKTGAYSTLYMEEGTRYDGSAGLGATSLTMELTEGRGEAFSDYDN